MLKSDILPLPASLPPVNLENSFGRYGLKIWSGGFCRFNAHPTNHPHVHESYHELCLVIGGHGEFVHGGERFSLSPGTVFFSETNVSHEISSYRSRDLHLVYFNLIITDGETPLSAKPIDAVIHRFRLGHSLSFADGGDLCAYVSIICIEGNRGFDMLRREEAARMLVLDALDRLSIQKSMPGNGTGGGSSANYVSKAITFIERTITTPVSVAEIARYCGCSDRHLRRVFGRETGKSVVDVINERKANIAAQQLLMRFSVTQVAQSLHIASTAHFSRMFKRHMGVSPKEYQRMHAPKPVLPKTVFQVGFKTDQTPVSE